MAERAALVASAVWLGLVVIISAGSRNFTWFDFYTGSYHLGDASLVALAGLGIIAACAFGLPWIMAGRK